MKSFNTTEAIGDELDQLYSEVDAGMLEPEDARALNMKLSILRDRAALIKNNIIEEKVERIMGILKDRHPDHLRRVI
jgi:hypothetical protein